MKTPELWFDQESSSEGDDIPQESYEELRIKMKSLDLEIQKTEKKIAEIEAGRADPADLPRARGRLKMLEGRKEKVKQRMVRIN